MATFFQIEALLCPLLLSRPQISSECKKDKKLSRNVTLSSTSIISIIIFKFEILKKKM